MRKLFGTTGVRGVFNKEFTPEMALKLGKALGTYLNGGDILIGTDTRTSSNTIKYAFIAGINSCGSNVYDAGIITTPTVAYLTKKLNLKAGVMVTASHNPPEYNGVKFWSNTGLGFDKKMESEIEETYYSEKFVNSSWDKVGKQLSPSNPSLVHINDILLKFDIEEIKKRKFTVALDIGSGAAYEIAPLLLKKLNCRIISLNSQPDGFFPGRPSKPSEDTLTSLISLMKEIDCDIGIAFDGDADRIVFVDEKGNFIQGDILIAAFARYLLKSMKNGKIVTTLESSIIVEEITEKYGGKLIWTPIGDINVGLAVMENKALFGAEECGVYVWPEFHLGPDSLYTIVKVMEMLTIENITISEFVEGIKRYPVMRKNIECDNKYKDKVMEKLNLKVDKVSGVLSVDRLDGLNLKFKEGRVLIRPSGTEPVIRITSEAKNKQDAVKLLGTIEEEILRIMG
ncbi:MAG: phosphoglucosamine mutase [Candidatus Odinarchaeia archaeon]